MEKPAGPFAFVSPTHPIGQRSVMPVVTPGEPIDVEAGFLRGHGTLVRHDGALVATVAGIVERVNKLVSVRPLRARYVGEVGDVVVCRVLEVGQKRWKVDVGGRQDAVLMLSSINLPGGEQRRRTAEDQLNMRHFYVEHDLVSAEVQAFFQDGSMSLHTRSLMYGKLQNGVLVIVTPTLMKRLKQHFHAFPFGVHCIFSMNGFVWISASKPRDTAAVEGDAPSSAGGMSSATFNAAPAEPDVVTPPTRGERERVCRVRNALVALDRMCIAVSPTTVTQVYEASVAAGLAAKDMLLPHVLPSICQTAMGTSGVHARPRQMSFRPQSTAWWWRPWVTMLIDVLSAAHERRLCNKSAHTAPSGGGASRELSRPRRCSSPAAAPRSSTSTWGRRGTQRWGRHGK
jgi:exosome complex component RRP4